VTEPIRREAHPLPLVLTHWVNALALLFLALSGLYIHYPVVGGLMSFAISAHVFWMFALLANVVVRAVFAFTVEDATMPGTREVERDFHNWLPQQANRHQLWPWIKYYLFIKRERPISAKYNPLQKLAYLLVPVLLLVAAYTGFCLWTPTAMWPVFRAGTNLVASWFGGGGDPMGMRIVHYCVMWAIVAFTAVHAYLANAHGVAPSAMIFGWRERPGSQA
jgi:Ni/Fe-hydrogenase 1 B-type cytochrome subunit